MLEDSPFPLEPLFSDGFSVGVSWGILGFSEVLGFSVELLPVEVLPLLGLLEEFTLFPWLEGFSTLLLLELLLLLLPELFLGFSKFPLVFILGTYS